jgi:hypothetical protein
MIYGDMAGKGKFYDGIGAPILAKGETVKGKARLRFMVYISLLSSKPFILDLYEGTVYITDRRLVGIRRPDPKKAALARLSYTADMDVLDTAERAKNVLEQGGFEFFSVDFNEIIRVKKPRLARAIEIWAPDPTTGKDIRIDIAPPKGFSDLFGEGEYERWLDRYGGK